MNLLFLFVSFFLIGSGAYGGGMAAISLIYHEIVTVHHWLTAAEMKEVITLAQMTPGPIAINAATFIGYRLAGIGGATLATLAVVSPSLLILLGASLFIHSAFYRRRIAPRFEPERLAAALRPGVLALLLYAVWTFGRSAVTSWSLALLAVISLALIFLLRKVNPVIVVLLAGLAGVLLYA